MLPPRHSNVYVVLMMFCSEVDGLLGLLCIGFFKIGERQVCTDSPKSPKAITP